VCCSVLQCVAVCCSGYVPVTRSNMCVAVCCSVLQCVAVCCSALQWLCTRHAVRHVCCRVLQCVAVGMYPSRSQICVLQCVALCHSVLQCVAVCCSGYVPVTRSILRHSACSSGETMAKIMSEKRISTPNWWVPVSRRAARLTCGDK